MLNFIAQKLQLSPAIIKREFSSYFHNSIADVFMIMFLVLSAFFTFRLGGWFELDQADLISFFGLHPYLYLFFIPALSMRMWAEEEHEGTIELLLSYPITVWQAVSSKFIASWLFLGLTLLLSFPVVITVCSLGDPDIGQLLSGYLASFLLGGTFLSLCALSSVLSPNQVVSYLFSFLMLLFLSGLGLQKISQIFPNWLSADILETLELFSIQAHYDGLQRGVIDMRDLLYNLSLIFYGLIGTTAILRCRKAAHPHNNSITFAGLIILSTVLLLVNFIGNSLTYRLDLTQDKLYTLSENSRSIAKELKHDTVLRFYFSKNHDKVDLKQKAFAQRVKDLLEEFSRHADGKVSYEILNPKAGSTEEDRALLDGIDPYNGKEAIDPAYMGLAINSLDKSFTLNRLLEMDESEIELGIARLFKRVIADNKPAIGIVSTLPIYGSKANPNAGQYSDKPQWTFLEELSKDYQVLQLPNSLPGISNKLQALILIHPPKLDTVTKYAIDQYIMNGGKVIAFLDSYAVLNSKRQQQGEEAVSASSELNELTQSWGITFKQDELIADKDNPQIINNEEKLFMLDLRRENFNENDRMTQKLKRLFFAYTGHFAIKETAGVNVTTLVRTSLNSQAYDMQKGLNEADVNKNFQASPKDYALALHLKGPLPSAFAKSKFAEKYAKHRSQSSGGELILFADADMLHDSFSFEKTREQSRKGRVKMSSNIDFVLNTVEELTTDGELIALRSRSRQSRRLEGLHRVNTKIEKDFAPKRQALREELYKKKIALVDLQKKQLKQFALSESELEQSQALSDDIKSIERQQAKLDSAQKTAQSRYQDRIVWLNVTIVPGLIILLALLSFWRRKLKVKKS